MYFYSLNIAHKNILGFSLNMKFKAVVIYSDLEVQFTLYTTYILHQFASPDTNLLLLH